KGKEKATKAEEKRNRRVTRSSHLRMTSIPLSLRPPRRLAAHFSQSLSVIPICIKVVSINQNFQQTIWHYHGGCQVGRVVDKGYRVPAIDSLRVIDGLTFYHTPGANPQAIVMMLGRQVYMEKISYIRFVIFEINGRGRAIILKLFLLYAVVLLCD
ncbi:unnamed protein product, partial [Prunus brigantina]